MATNIDPKEQIDRWVLEGIVKGVSLVVLQHGKEVIKHHSGLAKFTDEEEPVSDGTLFMIASITKTLTASCFMQFVEEGALCLSDSVVGFIPEFGENNKEGVTFLHLLTHTSGLGDQVEGKDELRARGGGMGEFLERIYRSRPLFTPGEGWQYSNCGFAVLARVVELLEGKRFGEILKERILAPLAMNDSALGCDESWDPRIAEIELPKGREENRKFLNTRYWRGMGAPWGALVSTTTDLGRFAEAILNGGELEGTRILSSATVDAMTRDQLPAVPGFPRDTGRIQGLAWGLRGSGSGGLFGDLTSPSSFGHGGATGTFLWVDPVRRITSVLLCNKESGGDACRFARLSNAIVASCT